MLILLSLVNYDGTLIDSSSNQLGSLRQRARDGSERERIPGLSEQEFKSNPAQDTLRKPLLLLLSLWNDYDSPT